ncbi:MAG TPA: O-antigen ligase family protein [Candidatus Dormibacteraeota bacterium]|nr:O-antigen ligase family protein [Candidatus Dormibacteraeota bacterium]
MSDIVCSPAIRTALPARKEIARAGWPEIAALLIVGYLSLGRTFAYLGLPWISLYIGEISLAAFLLFGPRTKQGLWLHVVQRAKRLRRLEWVLLLLLCDGAFEAFRGIVSGYPAFTAIRDTAFNYYPPFLLLGVWVGLKERDFLRRAVRALAWWNGCYGLAYVFLLSRLHWTMPGTAIAASKVPLFSEPLGSGIALLGLLAFEPKAKRVWHLLALNAIVMLGMQMRDEWLGFAVGVLALAWLTKRIKHAVVAGTILVALLGTLYIFHASLPAAATRGGKISIDYVAARAVAPFDRSLAANLSSQKAVVGFAGTATFRLVWWAGIWQAVHTNPTRALLGFGYGYPIGNLNPFIAPGNFIQTPHNDFFYALVYSGWLGVFLVVLLQAELFRLLWRSYRTSGQPFGLICWMAFLTESMFGDFFEGPMGAIPFFLLIGIALAPAIVTRYGRRRETPAGTFVLPAASPASRRTAEKQWA